MCLGYSLGIEMTVVGGNMSELCLHNVSHDVNHQMFISAHGVAMPTSVTDGQQDPNAEH